LEAGAVVAALGDFDADGVVLQGLELELGVFVDDGDCRSGAAGELLCPGV